MLSAFALVLALAAPGDRARCDPDAPAVALGPADAASVVQAYLDPADGEALRTWMALRDLSRERPTLRIEVRLAEPAERTDPLSAGVRAWAFAAARAGKLEPALRVVAGDGPAWVAARLHTPSGRKQLEKRVALPDAALPTACATRHVDAATAIVAARFEHFGNPVYRLPVFAIDDIVFDDPPGVLRVRSELGRAGQRARDRIDPPVSPPVPTLKATSARMRRPAIGGLLLGGPGLPHRFVLMARDEEDPNLFMMLPMLLDFRAEHPGRLAVHVVARGGTVGGMRLRHRLCAASRLGLERAYIEVLANPPSDDGFRLGDVAELLRRLDEVPEKNCENEPDPAELDLPDGAWLDGLPRTRAELSSLPATMRMLQAAARPLGPLLRGGGDAP